MPVLGCALMASEDGEVALLILGSSSSLLNPFRGPLAHRMAVLGLVTLPSDYESSGEGSVM